MEYCQKDGKKTKYSTGMAVPGFGESSSLMNERNYGEKSHVTVTLIT
jgi:hypothetical protein